MEVAYLMKLEVCCTWGNLGYSRSSKDLLALCEERGLELYSQVQCLQRVPTWSSLASLGENIATLWVIQSRKFKVFFNSAFSLALTFHWLMACMTLMVNFLLVGTFHIVLALATLISFSAMLSLNLFFVLPIYHLYFLHVHFGKIEFWT